MKSDTSGAPTCEGRLNIDLAWLRRRGMLTPGRYSTLTWSRSGEQTGSITLAAQSDGVRLIFRCRRCYRLRYASQGESRPDQRALDRARKIAKRLHDRWGGTTEVEYEFPPKPPRMRWAYRRLLNCR
jgi:hypothetical protein